jgi:hypothetical protein
MSMPISYEINRETRLVVCTGFGVVTDDEVLQVHEQMVKDANFDSSFSELVDADAITSTTVTPSSMRMLAVGIRPVARVSDGSQPARR